jgi:hypothetical protein
MRLISVQLHKAIQYLVPLHGFEPKHISDNEHYLKHDFRINWILYNYKLDHFI